MASKRTPGNGIDQLLGLYEQRRHQFDYFRLQVVGFFQTSPELNQGQLPIIHSIKSRLKDPDHLRAKLQKKLQERVIDSNNLFSSITDLAGVRVLHLYTQQVELLHQAVLAHVKAGFWSLHEPPTAYSWDPETTEYFSRLGLNAVTRESYYTSVHYVVKPQPNIDITCEIQVRTLFEEAWGEIDHTFNYPEPTSVLACREQLRVLAKLASTGTRLADSIFRISAAEAVPAPRGRPR